MASIDSMWETLSLGTEKQPPPPIWKIRFEDKEKILEWFNKAIPFFSSQMESEISRMLENSAFYKGDQDERNVPIFQRDREPTKKPRADITVNFCFEFVETWVNRLSQFAPKIIVTPRKDEHVDRIKAEASQETIDYIFEKEKMAFILQEFQLLTKILGEAYTYTTWDPYKGEISPRFLKEREDQRSKNKGLQESLKIEDDNGETISVDNPIRVGDVKYEVLPGWRVILEPCLKYSDVNYIIVASYPYLDDVLAQHPDKEEDIKKGTSAPTYLSDIPEGRVEVLELWHKSSDFLEDGRYIKFCRGILLENKGHPYNHKNLPVTRLTDIDIHNEIRGRSGLENLKRLQIMYNKLTTLMWRNAALVAHPKWMVPKGSANIVQLGNADTVVEYSGGVPPRVDQPQAITGDIFNFRENIRKEAERVFMIQGISFGAPPPNIRSGLQIAQLQEEQQKAVNFHIVKRNSAIEEIARQTHSIVSQFYEKDDDRMIRVIGKDKEVILKSLDPDNIKGEFDIRCQNSSGLPDGKFGKLDLLVQLRNTFGEAVVPNEVVIDAYEIGRPEKFAKFATASVERAEWDIQLMMKGEAPPDPEPYEDHILKWQIYVAAMRKTSFARSPEKTRELFKSQLLATELLMDQKAKSNDTFKQKLSLLDGYPIYFPSMEAKVVMPPTGAPAPIPESISADMGGVVPPPEPEM